MKKILILKTGGTIKSLISHKGDFEHWIISGMQVDSNDVTVIDVRNDTFLPDYEDISGIVITGSHSMITRYHDWNERTAKWLPGAVEREIPVLGICYGHQLLAYALGGEAGDNPKGNEYGTVDINLTDDAHEDTLFKGLPNIFKAHVTHSQSVLELPQNAKRLSSSDMDANQAFAFGNNAWGVQFHPEYDTEVVTTYITTFKDMLLEEKQDVNSLLDQVTETPHSLELLTRFVNIINNRL
jgi:GMP synthase (glutamine-hydrolysing)